MNKTCKVIWSHTHSQMVVVSEIASAKGKTPSTTVASNPVANQGNAGSNNGKAGVFCVTIPLVASLALAFGALSAPAVCAQGLPAGALPNGASVAAGQARVSSNGANMVIDQTSQRAIINWQSFNVGAGAQVQFNQPGSSASTLNRVTGPEASTILGRITAPGQVIISNGNGVYFGRGSMVDVGSLIATTHSIGNDRFMAGELTFERNGATGSVVNEGELRAKLEGYIALIAPEVRNQGLIVATKGSVALAAGEVVELQLDPNNKLTNIRVEAGQWQALVDNRQAIEAEGGLVILSSMAARELQGSVVSNSGSINASSMTSVGGRVILTGDDITLKAGSSITVTGATGGGQVLVGGDWQGGASSERRVLADPHALHQATRVTMEQGATIDASATDTGKGGTVVLWSDVSRSNSVTNASGAIYAKGGARGGDGGQIETSGGLLITEGVTGSAAAPMGKSGEWLFDPYDIEIIAPGSNTNVSISGGALTASGNSSKITNASIQNLLNAGTSVTVSTAGNAAGAQGGSILVSAPIVAAGSANLYLTADNGITFNADVTTRGNLLAQAKGFIGLYLGKNLTTNGGNLSLLSNSGNVTSGTFAGEVVLFGSNTLNSGGGNIMLGGAGASGYAYRGGYSGSAIDIRTNVSILSGGGNVSISGQSNPSGTAGTVNANRGYGVGISTGFKLDSGTGSINIDGVSNGDHGVWLGPQGITYIWGDGSIEGGGFAITSASTAAAAITIKGESTVGFTGFGANYYASSSNSLIQTTGATGGGISITGLSNGSVSSPILLGGETRGETDTLQILSNKGDISLNANGPIHVYYQQVYLGNRKDATAVNTVTPLATTASGNVLIKSQSMAAAVAASDRMYVGTTGKLTVEPYSDAFASAFTWSGALATLDTTGTLNDWDATGSFAPLKILNMSELGGLTIGKSTSTTDVTISNNITVGGPISLNGGAVALNANLSTTETTTGDVQFKTTGLSGAGNISVAAGRGLTANQSGTSTYSGVISGTTSTLTKEGSGTLTLSGVNTYSGGTSISAGTLTTTTTSALGTGAVSLDNTAGANLSVSGTLSVGSLGGGGTNGGNVAIGSGFTLTAGALNTSTTYDGVISGAGALAKSGSGTLTLKGINTYSGATTVSAGTLAAGNASALGTTAAGTTVASGAVLDLQDVVIAAEAMAINGGTLRTSTGTSSLSGAVTMGASSTVDVSGTQLSLSGVVSGAGKALTKTGAGKLVLSGTNTYDGGTNLNAGALNLGASGAIGSSGTIGFGGGTLQYSASNTTDYSSRFNTAANQAYSVDTNSQSVTLGTALSSTGGTLTKLGSGTLTLTGSNSYSGATTISDGTLQVGSGSTAGSLGSGSVTNNAALTFNRSDAITVGNAISGSGTVSVKGGNTTTLTANSIYTGATSIDTGTTLVLQNDAPNTGSSAFNGLGTLAIESAGTSFTNAMSTSTLRSGGLVLGSTLGGLRLGKTGNTSAITIDNAYSIAGGLEVYGGAVTVSQAFASTGLISITATGNLTINDSISTTNATSSAVVLVAGSGQAAGSATGGDISIASGKSITVGSGGTAKLYTGSTAGSTNVLSLLTSGSGRFRYNSTATTTNFTTALGTGLNAIYRERPTASIASMTLSTTYGDSLPTVTATGTVNGDVSNYSIVGAAYSGANRLRASNTAYTINTNLTGLGYNVTGVSSGNLTVNAKALTISGLSSQSRDYDGALAATVNGVAALQASVAAGTGTNSDGKSYTSDTVNLTGAATGTFNNKDVATASSVSFAGLSLTGSDAGNYTLTAHASDTTARITPKTVSLSASKTYDGTTGLTAAVTLGTGVGSETLTYSGATASDAHVATANKFIDAITLVNASDGSGGLAGNYQLPAFNVANAPVTIAAKTLTHTLTNTGLTKVYDGTSNAPTGFTPIWSVSGLVSGDTAASLNMTGAAYNSANVGATTLTASGLAIGTVTGTRSSLASDYVLDATSKSVSAAITRAALTVRANNDARFVAQSDAANFTGVSYSGFVNGETSAVLGGSATVTRTNAGTIAAALYPGVLQPSGLTSSNYAISYANGDFTIVPSNQLLVRVANVSNTYGTATPYAISSVEYESGGSVYRLDNNSVASSTVAINSSNLVTVNDGASGQASFTVAPKSAATSSAGKLKVGSYQLDVSGTVTENSINFSNMVTVVGSHQVNTKALTASATGVSKVYDGTTSMSGVTLGLSTLESSDVVTVNGLGAFASRNVGSGISYTVSGLSLSGTDAGNYHLGGGTNFSANNGQITQRALVLAYTGVNKVYDGGTSASVITSDDRVSGDTLTINRSATFVDKNVGAGKAVSISGVSLSGTDAGNYSFTSTGSTTATITRLNSVTWIGGASGNWFDPANWAGGAVPDLSNVANVVIPSGVVVSFATAGAVSPADATSAVNIDGLGSAGSLTQTNGTLNVGSGGMTLAGYTQSSGALSSTGAISLASLTQTGGNLSTQGNLSVSQGFNQGTLGSISVAGNTSITDVSGGVAVGNLSTTGTTQISSTGGDITQAAGTTIVSGGATTLNASNGGTPANITLTGANNDFTGAVSASGANVALVDVNALTLGTVTATGNLTASSTGALNLGTSTVGGNLSANSGNGNITQTGALAVTGTSTLNAGTGNVTLTNAGNIIANGVTVTADNSLIVGDKAGDASAAAYAADKAAANKAATDSVTASTVPFSAKLPLVSDSITPTMSGGSGSVSPASSNTASPAAAGSNTPGVQIELLAPAQPSQMGLVSVVLPPQTSTIGTGFVFTLPAEVVPQLTAEVKVSLANGAELPNWLRFNAQTGEFTATAVPDRAFPIQVSLSIGSQQLMVVISEKQ